jgi:surface antigen
LVSIIDDISGEIMRVSIINGGFSKQMKVFAGIHVLLLVLFFCGEFSQAAKLGNSLGLKTTPMPKYQAGTTFVYSDGSWETVIKVGPEGITWRNHRGSISTGSPDFIYKRFKWQTKKRYGYRDFKQTTFIMSPPTPPLWPLEVGNKTRFDEKGRWFDELGVESRYDSFWSCGVIGTEKVSVGAGDFDTWKITCKRYPDKFRSTSKTREYRTWYYAPIVNHWVVEDRDYNGYRENRSKELIAVLPDLQTFTADENDILSIQKQFQNALEANQIGDTNVWENFNQQLVIGVTPVKSFKHPNGGICRQYLQVLAKEGLPYEFPGIACRNEKGRWAIPRR